MITKQVGIQRIIDTIVVIENLRLRLGFTGDEGAVPSMIFLSSFTGWFFGISKNKIQQVIQNPIKDRMPSQGIEKIEIDKPLLKDDEVLVKVMASSLNYNSIWSSLCHPLTPTQLITSYVQRNPMEQDHDIDKYIFDILKWVYICKSLIFLLSSVG